MPMRARVTTRLRPLRFGVLADLTSANNVVEAVGVKRVLWGGGFPKVTMPVGVTNGAPPGKTQPLRLPIQDGALCGVRHPVTVNCYLRRRHWRGCLDR